MKKLLLLVLVTLFTLTGCSNMYGTSLDPMESSIFRRAEVKKCRVTVDSLEVKSGAGDRFRTIATLNKNDEVNVLGEYNDWYIIRMDNNQIGCIDSDKTQPIVDEEPQQPEEPEAPRPQPPQEEQEPGETVPVPGPEPAPEPEPTPEPGPEPEPEPVPEPDQSLVAQEREMVRLLNQERQKNSLPTLKVDPELTRVARIKSQDMVDNDYFSHYSPTYGSPFDMLKQFNIEYLHAGENIALNTSVDKAHTALMGSSGHRQNILNQNFTYVGIGVKRKDRRSFIYTQIFISKPR